MAKIFNPLDVVEMGESTSSSDTMLKSESALSNEKYGSCPKCQGTFEMSKLADSTPSFWCEKCKVSAPVKV